MRNALVAAIAILALAACSVPEHETPGGETMGPAAFRYVAPARAADIYDSGSEQRRLGDLNGYAAQAKACPNGYDIVVRSPGFDFARDDDSQDWFENVIYLARCRA